MWSPALKLTWRQSRRPSVSPRKNIARWGPWFRRPRVSIPPTKSLKTRPSGWNRLRLLEYQVEGFLQARGDLMGFDNSCTTDRTQVRVPLVVSFVELI